MNPTNPHSFFKSQPKNINDCGYRITYTIEGDTLLTKEFIKDGILTTITIKIEKNGNVTTTANTYRPSKDLFIGKKMNYELLTNISNGSTTLHMDNNDPAGEGFILDQTRNFNQTTLTKSFLSQHAYFTKDESDAYFISAGFISATFAGLTVLGFIETVVSAYLMFKKMKDKLPFKTDNVVFIGGNIKESADTNSLSIRQNRNIVYVDALLRSGFKGLKGYDKERR